MDLRLAARAALILAASVAIGSVALAQGPKSPPPNWSQTVTKEPSGDTQEFNAKQLDIIQKVTNYFNQMGDIKGTFVQFTPDSKRMRGKFFFKRPGKFRFEYSLPSKQIVVSDGKYMAVQDHDLKTDDRYGLDQTPFRVLLRKEVDLLKDAKILEVGETEDRIVLALQDKAPDTVGSIKLFLLRKQPHDLREWITMDAQGLQTRIELNEVQKVDDMDPGLFVPPPVALQKIQ